MHHATKAGSGLLQLRTKRTHLNKVTNQWTTLLMKGKSFTGPKSHQHGVIEGQTICAWYLAMSERCRQRGRKYKCNQESIFMNGANSNDWSEDTVIRCSFVDDIFRTRR